LRTFAALSHIKNEEKEMNITNVGVIECGNATIPALRNDVSATNGYLVTKVLTKHTTANKLAREYYPDAEFVTDSSSIINDNNIQLIIIAGSKDKDLTVVSQAFGAGKLVRVL
jgi:predicted dehydrogenase